MDQVTQQNAAMVEQTAAASESLSGEAQGLMRMIGQFKTKAESGPVGRRAVAQG